MSADALGPQFKDFAPGDAYRGDSNKPKLASGDEFGQKMERVSAAANNAAFQSKDIMEGDMALRSHLDPHKSRFN